MTRILLICLGNICRSPTAQAVFQQKINNAGLAGRVFLDSAGTASWHVGKAPDSRAIAAGASEGYDLSHLRGRQVQDEDFESFDLLLAMDGSNLHELQAQCPGEHQHKVKLFLSFSGVEGVTDVPDPYYGGDEGFQQVIALIERASDNLVARIREDGL